MRGNHNKLDPLTTQRYMRYMRYSCGFSGISTRIHPLQMIHIRYTKVPWGLIVFPCS